jgi:hypothetical protein
LLLRSAQRSLRAVHGEWWHEHHRSLRYDGASENVQQGVVRPDIRWLRAYSQR